MNITKNKIVYYNDDLFKIGVIIVYHDVDYFNTGFVRPHK
jgi:hypothetical protein